MRLTPEEWEGAADLLDQLSQQCEIAFEEHAPAARKWVQKQINRLTAMADKRAEHPKSRQ